MAHFGDFADLCSTASSLTVCVLFNPQYPKCRVTPVVQGKLTCLGTIILDVVAITLTIVLLWRTQKRTASVGRREMQVLLAFYLLASFCEIFTIGGVLAADSRALWAFAAVHLAIVSTAFWILLYNGILVFQWIDDGTTLSMSLLGIPSLLHFIATLYIALDTGFGFSYLFMDSVDAPNHNIALYILCLLLPLLYLVVYFVLMIFVLLKVLENLEPIAFLCLAALSFAVGQVFNFTVGNIICHNVRGAVNGALFQTLFTLIAVWLLWRFWSSITEDEYPTIDSLMDGTHIYLDEEVPNNPSFAEKPQSYPAYLPSEPTFQAITVQNPKREAILSTLDVLDKDQKLFLDSAEVVVKILIKSETRPDCITIIQRSPSHTETRIDLSASDDWIERFIILARHKGDGLPMFHGSTLDSYLTGPILQKIGEERSKFFAGRKDIIDSGLVGMLADNPVVAREFARHLATSIREAGEPLSDSLYEALAEMLTHQIHITSNHVMNEVGQQIGHAATHTRVAAFSTTLLHALMTTMGKFLRKSMSITITKAALTSAGNKLLIKTIVTAVFTTIATHLGVATTGTLLPWVVAPLVRAFAAKEISLFPKSLAQEIAPEIRSVLAGEEFRGQNRSVLEDLFRVVFRDGAKQLAETMVLETDVAENARAAAEEWLRENGSAGGGAAVHHYMVG